MRRASPSSSSAPATAAAADAETTTATAAAPAAAAPGPALHQRPFPPLPAPPPRLSLVLPRAGDLSRRSLLPGPFLQSLVIHCPREHHDLYRRFVLVRRFLVLSTDGAFYTHTLRTRLTRDDLPRPLLPLPPPLAPWDIVKVLDLVRCYPLTTDGDDHALVPRVRWELVRVRWRNAHETWVPIELLAGQPVNLLQEFYVQAINSWHFAERLHRPSLGLYRTELELWLHHPEFQGFYRQLARRRALCAALDRHHAPQETTASDDRDVVVDPELHNAATLLRMPPGSGRMRKPPAFGDVPVVMPTLPPVVAVASSTSAAAPLDSSEPLRKKKKTMASATAAVTATTTTKSKATTTSKTDKATKEKAKTTTPTTKRKTKTSATASTEDPEATTSSSSNNKKKKTPKTKTAHKRLRWSQVADENENDDDLPDLSQPPTAPLTQARDNQRAKDTDTTTRKRKRLRQPEPETETSRASSVVVVPDDEEEDDEEVVVVGVSRTPPPKKPRKTPLRPSATGSSGIRSAVDDGGTTTEDESDQGDDDNGARDDGPLGSIRCACGATTAAGAYRGQWLQCGVCGVWEHAECVGYVLDGPAPLGLPSSELEDAHRCTSCDSIAMTTRYRKLARDPPQLVRWLHQCCRTRNERQLLKLLRDTGALATDKNEWRVPKAEGHGTLLMAAARNGLVRAVKKLVRRHKAHLMAVDGEAWTVLHHAIIGGSEAVVRFLSVRAPAALWTQRDRRGRAPFHLVLASPTLNHLSLTILKSHRELAAMGDFEGNLPLAYACRVVNAATVKVCRRLLRVHGAAAMAHAASSPSSPLIALCRGAGGAKGPDKARYIREIVHRFLDFDPLGTCLRQRDERGWSALHHAAAVGNHELVAFLSGLPTVDREEITYDSGETALHLAARAGSALTARVLLEKRLDVLAVDSIGWIPVLRAPSAPCLREFLHYDLDEQLEKINEMARSFKHREAMHRWVHLVTTDPIAFNTVNDGLQYRVEELDQLEELWSLHRAFVRIDNKLDYLLHVVFPSAQQRSGSSSDHARRLSGSSSNAANDDDDDAKSQQTTPPKPLEIALSATSPDGYWTQFVAQTETLDPVVFRSRLRIVLHRGEHSRLDNPTLVLIRLVSGLLQPRTGLFVRRRDDNSLEPSSARVADGRTLTEFYVLGELLAHLVLMNVPVGEIAEFSSPFLSQVLQVKPGFSQQQHKAVALSEDWVAFAEALAKGFEEVLPATLLMLRVPEFRILLNARSWGFNVLLVDWAQAFEWVGFSDAADDESAQGTMLGEDDVAVTWWARAVMELVEEERVMLVLALSGTYHRAQQDFFSSHGGLSVLDSRLTDDAPVNRIRIERYKPATANTEDGDDSRHWDALALVFDPTTRTLTMPKYSSYEIFQAALLRFVRGVERWEDCVLPPRLAPQPQQVQQTRQQPTVSEGAAAAADHDASDRPPATSLAPQQQQQQHKPSEAPTPTPLMQVAEISEQRNSENHIEERPRQPPASESPVSSSEKEAGECSPSPSPESQDESSESQTLAAGECAAEAAGSHVKDQSIVDHAHGSRVGDDNAAAHAHDTPEQGCDGETTLSPAPEAPNDEHDGTLGSTAAQPEIDDHQLESDTSVAPPFQVTEGENERLCEGDDGVSASCDAEGDGPGNGKEDDEGSSPRDQENRDFPCEQDDGVLPPSAPAQLQEEPQPPPPLEEQATTEQTVRPVDESDPAAEPPSAPALVLPPVKHVLVTDDLELTHASSTARSD